MQASLQMIETIPPRYLGSRRTSPIHATTVSIVTEQTVGLMSGGLLLPVPAAPEGCSSQMVQLSWVLGFELCLAESQDLLQFEIPVAISSGPGAPFAGSGGWWAFHALSVSR